MLRLHKEVATPFGVATSLWSKGIEPILMGLSSGQSLHPGSTGGLLNFLDSHWLLFPL